MTAAINHTARVTIVHGDAPKGGKLVVGPNALVITDLRIQFKMEKTLKPHPNNCDLIITNLNPSSRAFCQRDPLRVQVEAGYNGETELVFAGDCRYAMSALKTPDWETHFELGDGEAAYNEAQLNRSYGAGTNARTIVADAAGAMGLKMPTSFADAEELFKQVSTGASFTGPASGAMTRTLNSVGLEWSIQNGTIQLIRGKAPAPGEAIFISAATGMKGTPELGKPPKKGGPAPVKVVMRLTPRIRCGGLVQIQARNVTGAYRVEKLVHSGDTLGDNWQTEIEAIPL